MYSLQRAQGSLLAGTVWDWHWTLSPTRLYSRLIARFDETQSEPIIRVKFMNDSVSRRLSLAIIVAAAALATPALAIDCVRGYQRVQGNLIATPYCQDQSLAQVAREYGIPATASKIRNNPNYKKEVCRTVFNDIRIQTTCLNAGVPEGRGFR